MAAVLHYTSFRHAQDLAVLQAALVDLAAKLAQIPTNAPVERYRLVRSGPNGLRMVFDKRTGDTYVMSPETRGEWYRLGQSLAAAQEGLAIEPGR